MLLDIREIDYIDIAAEETRTGAPIVFVHEGLGCVAMWRSFPDHLRTAIGSPRMMAYSRHGYGRSAPRAKPFGLSYLHEEAIEVLPQLLDPLEIRAPVLVGHSDGASISLIHAAAGYAVSGIVLIAPHVFVEECTVQGVRAAAAEFSCGRLRGRLARHHNDPIATFESWSSIWLDARFRAWTIEESLPRIRVPVLVIQGVDDQYGTPRQLAAIERGCGGPVRVHELPGVGHAPHLEQEALTTALIRDWLADQHLLSCEAN